MTTLKHFANPNTNSTKSAAPKVLQITDIGDYMHKQAEIGKKEFSDAFAEWHKARANGQEAQTLLMFINIGKTERVGSFCEKDYYGKKLTVDIHKANDWLQKEYDLLTIIEVHWNGKALFMGIQKHQLTKDQTHDYIGEYYEVNQLEHIGLALQLDLSFNNAWFQMWRTVWFSGKIKNVDVPKIYRILD